MGEKRRVILVTDGDCVAGAAVETAARNIGARTISLSACMQFPYTADELLQLIRSTPHDPVVVMVDDRGESGRGEGESILERLARNPGLEILGAVAVASHTPHVRGVRVDASVTATGEVVRAGVNKDGLVRLDGQPIVQGDTVDVLERLGVSVIVGLGDPGKMNYADDARLGAPVTTRALQLVLELAESKPAPARS